MQQVNVRTGVNRYQRIAMQVYSWGILAMIAYNWGCYPGSIVGVFGWAFVWPLYVPAAILRALLWGDSIMIVDICPGPMTGGGLR